MQNRHSYIWFVSAAALILMITMGVRQSLGLFMAPIYNDTGIGILEISFALAIAQFVWGASQPIAGALADHYGPGRVLAGGIIILALSTSLAPIFLSSWGLVFTLGLMSAVGSGAGSFSVLLGAAGQRVPENARGHANGVINAGGSFGQFVFAPMVQKFISLFGWVGAMWALTIIALASLPLARVLRRRPESELEHKHEHAHQPVVAQKSEPSEIAKSASVKSKSGLRTALYDSMSNPSYLLLHAGFFTCGFHIAFLVTHLPGQVSFCGLPVEVASWSLGIIGLANIAGSLFFGWGVGRYRSKYLLFWLYASRALLVFIFLLAPKTAMTFYMLAIGLGFTWLATVPPTAALVGKLFGVRYLGTLFGMTLLSHQIGGFLGAWLGGLAITELGSYDMMWYADMALASLAAVLNLPIKEEKVYRLQPA